MNMTYRDVAIDDAFIDRVMTEAKTQHIDEVMLIIGDGGFGIGEVVRMQT